MSIPSGPRKYNIFICHRYKDGDLYDRLRRALKAVPKFRYRNLSVQDDMLLSFRGEAGTKRSISARVKRCDVVLVFAHSSGKWIAHELDAAKCYNIPVISILDPKRVADPAKRARTEMVSLHRCGEVNLKVPNQIVAAIREHARPQPHVADVPQGILLPKEPISTPADIARRINARPGREGFVARLSMLFRRRAPENEDRAQ